ncbi:MAG TPA: threonine/serine dehydratase [Thermoanaerobaculia bacterium]|nr:threonine/serine dehydratase [Thermoanaerobaculia bacterium]
MTESTATIAPADISATYEVIKPYVRRTPVLELSGAELGLPPCTIILKLELMQHAGAFKTRGAFANLLLRNVPAAGVAAASGGNHGVAVAYAASVLGIRARIFIPTIASPAKVQRIRDYGAELVIGGDRYGEALAASERYVRESGAMPVHAFDQRETLLGQGSVGLELAQQAAPIDTVLSAVGGGGLIGGVAAWFAGSVTIVGVEPSDAPTLTRALEAGKPVDAPAGGIAADSLAPYRIGEACYPIAKQHVSKVLLVSDDDIRRAQQTLWNAARIVAEPGGSAAFGALLAGYYVPRRDERVAVLVSGANTTAVDFTR